MKFAFGLATALSAALVLGMTSPAGSSNSSSQPNFVVGGGHTLTGFTLCGDTNFAINGRVGADLNGLAGRGTLQLTFPANPQEIFCERGHITAKVDCVLVGGDGPGTAKVTAEITHVTGDVAAIAPVGLELRADVLDSGAPGGVGDMIGIRRLPPGDRCDFAGPLMLSPVDRGNIHVRQAS